MNNLNAPDTRLKVKTAQETNLETVHAMQICIHKLHKPTTFQHCSFYTQTDAYQSSGPLLFILYIC
jgi:hypothetical protein